MSFITVVVTDENGRDVGDHVVIPSDILQGADNAHFNCLRFVDPYGDTVFNRSQVAVVKGELRILKDGLADKFHRELIGEIESLCDACLSTIHLYLKFIGD